MSLEQAINDHASAIRELAAAIKAASAGVPIKAELVTTAGVSVAETEQQHVMAQVEADRKPSSAKEAINAALAKAKADKEKASAPAPTPAPVEEPESEDQEGDDGLLGGEEEAKVLDWKADVMPVLRQVGKDKTKLAGLLADFDVGAGKTYKTANLLPAEVYPQLVAAANKLLGK